VSAAVRKGNGCVDNDSNAGDLFPGLQNPRNRNSPRTVCGTSIQFAGSSFIGNEGDRTMTIVVTRTGTDLSATATADYVVTDGTATQRTDYELAGGRVVFAPGESTKTISLLLVDDAYVEPMENAVIKLNNVIGASFSDAGTTAQVNIVDNDFVAPSTNPIDEARFFVQQHYYDFLSRYPDPSGWDFWTSQITQCGTDAACLRSKRIDVSNSFFYELEFQQSGSYVFRLYRAAYGNNQPFPNPNSDPSHPNEEKKLPAYLNFMNDRARVPGGPQLAAFQLALAQAFVQRPEFLARYPLGSFPDGPTFVDALLATVRNDTGADLAAQRQPLINLFNQAGGGTAGRSNVIYRLADDNAQSNPINNRAFIDAEYNRAFVFTQYAGYLRRDTDVAGFLFWLGQVNAGALRDISKQHAMVCSFLTSAEYQMRFSTVLTHSNSECP